jgi:putative SOS response-associated peptidase YedK
MCGRYTIIDGKVVLATFVALERAKRAANIFDGLPNYNASPMQKLPVVAIRGGDLTIGLMQWWLVPHWSKDGKPTVSAFNARAENLEQSRLFSPYFRSRRCLIPADSFYEWKKPLRQPDTTTGGKPPKKEPYRIRLKGETPFMFAGLFSVWKNPEGEQLVSFTIITTEPNSLVAPIHKRMPVILPEKYFEQWLDRNFKDTTELKKLLLAYSDKEMEAYRVSTVVNTSTNNTEECIKPL